MKQHLLGGGTEEVLTEADRRKKKAEETRKATAAKQAGIKDVSEHYDGWMERAIDAITRALAGSKDGTVSADEAQELLRETPGHHNAWGAAFHTAAKRHLIAPTGKYVMSTRKASHRRRIQLWVKGGKA